MIAPDHAVKTCRVSEEVSTGVVTDTTAVVPSAHHPDPTGLPKGEFTIRLNSCAKTARSRMAAFMTTDGVNWVPEEFPVPVPSQPTHPYCSPHPPHRYCSREPGMNAVAVTITGVPLAYQPHGPGLQATVAKFAETVRAYSCAHWAS